ncbi:MAG: sulfite exporter TauE/SafE family protein [Deltaproteobacteria bacterium]|nr:sulfite exporter TauE/SafE family protein [Deltaproteobacteria bacterium]
MATFLNADFANLIQQGSVLSFFLAFVGGVLASLTPCVYPMIPITVSFIAGRATSRIHAFWLSLIYVLGMSVMYIFAVLTGKVFGVFTMSAPFYIGVGGVILFFGLLQLGWLPLKIPQFSVGHFREGASGGAHAEAFMMGLTSGFIAAPCTVPILGVILTFIATSQSIVTGTLLMFSFSLGLGLLLFFLGLFSGLLATLPKSGAWLLTIKKIAGYCFLGIGFYFIGRGLFYF